MTIDERLDHLKTLLHSMHDHIEAQNKIIMRQKKIIDRFNNAGNIYDNLTNEDKRDLLVLLDEDAKESFYQDQSILDENLEKICDLFAILYPQYEIDINEVEEIVHRASDYIYEAQFNDDIEKDSLGYILWDEYSIGEEIEF